VAVAFDAGNLEAVAMKLRAKQPDAKLILCADNDIHSDGKPNTGLNAATKAANAVNGLIAVPEMGGAKCDFNDLAGVSGAGAVKQAIEAAEATASFTKKNPTAGLVCKKLSEIEAKPIRWLWPGRIARGKVSMIAGHPGLGKSQITASLAAIVTTAGRWPVDRTTCERGSVLFLSAEDDPADTIRPRLEAAGADLDRVHVLQSVRDGFNAAGEEVQRAFNLREDIRRLEDALQEISDVALVVIDPVSAYLGGADSHNNAEVRALLAPLSDMAARCGVAVVAVSHLNKGGGGSDALSRVTGSLAFVAAARAAYIVAKDPEDDSRRLFLPAKNNIGADIGGLAFRIEPVSMAGGIETSRIAWETEAVRNMNADDVMRPAEIREDRSAVEDAAEFLRGLLADGPMAAKAVYREASDAGHSQASIRRAQKSAGVEVVKDGMAGGWQWRLAPKMLKTPEDAQPKTLSAFGKNERLRESEANSSDDQGERF
jgi:energy-coupling factor transporter ATP-binding protein EcfA2